MSKKFSKVDWDEGTPFHVLSKHGFFAYSGSDGDLLRKHGLGGWRVSVYGSYSVRIQKKRPEIGGWATKRTWEVEFGEELRDDQIEEFDTVLGELVENKKLEN